MCNLRVVFGFSLSVTVVEQQKPRPATDFRSPKVRRSVCYRPKKHEYSKLGSDTGCAVPAFDKIVQLSGSQRDEKMTPSSDTDENEEIVDVFQFGLSNRVRTACRLDGEDL